MQNQGLKTRLEQIHLDYLVTTFPILERGASQKSLNRGLLDLVAEDCVFELKSRLYVQNQLAQRKRPKSDYCWWMLDEIQRVKNQEWCEKECYLPFWIFLIAQTKDPLNQATLCEDYIFQRDIYIVPWVAHELVQTNAPGTSRYLGLSRLLKNYNFDSYSVPKGNISLACCLPSFVQSLF